MIRLWFLVEACGARRVEAQDTHKVLIRNYWSAKATAKPGCALRATSPKSKIGSEFKIV